MSSSIHRPSARRWVIAVACAALAMAACGPEAMEGGMGERMDDGMEDMENGMGGMVAGDEAEVTVAGEADHSLRSDGSLGWVGYRLDDDRGREETYSWGPAFLYVDEGTRTFEVGGEAVTVQAGEATFVEEDVRHTGTDGTFWAFVLTEPHADPARGLEQADREFSSGPLEGLPEGQVQSRFLVVDLPPRAGRTSVHTHPGPEFIYVSEGVIEYETALEDTVELAAGDTAALPATTAVQKRNVSDAPARFWSWFIVDPDKPFASEATFDRE